MTCRAEKDAIARRAADIVNHDVVILDAGTTTGRLAHYLRGRVGLTVVTCGLSALRELVDDPDIALVLLGGRVRHVSEGTVGPYAELTLRRITAGAAFLGADGLAAGRGICEADPAQTSLKELMAARAREVYVLADSTKLGHPPLDAWAPLDRPWTLVTDSAARPDQLAPFRDLPNVRVLVAE